LDNLSIFPRPRQLRRLRLLQTGFNPNPGVSGTISLPSTIWYAPPPPTGRPRDAACRNCAALVPAYRAGSGLPRWLT